MKTVLVTLALIIFSASSMAVEMPELARKNGCTTCHAIDHKVIGPAWQDVALRYKNTKTYNYADQPYSLEDGLVKKVSLGGRSNWGDAIMKPNDPDGTHLGDIRQLVQFILKLQLPSTMAAFKEQGVEPGNGKSFKDCSDCPEMVMVPPGTFMMGQPAIQEQRTITEAFAVGKFEITFDEWNACVMDGGCEGYQPDDNGFGRGRRPVVNVNVNDITKYVQWLSQKTGQSYRQMTAEEWEYAAKAGTTTAYPWGDAIGVGHANCDGCGSQWDGKQSAPVGSFQPNAFGLYDMNGNARERVSDCFHHNCSNHLICGGSWYEGPLRLRSLCLESDSTEARDIDDGFRVARDIPFHR